jgi:hypothetical protein
VSESTRHGVDRGSDHDCHHPRVEVAAQLPGDLEAGQQFFEGLYCGVHIGVAVETAPAVGTDAVPRDLDDRRHVVAVFFHELKVRVDVGAQHVRAGRVGQDPGPHVGLALLEDFEHHLLDQVVLAGEVVADQAFADPDPRTDPGQGRAREADLGDGVDRRLDDLGVSGGLGERPPLVSGSAVWTRVKRLARSLKSCCRFARLRLRVVPEAAWHPWAEQPRDLLLFAGDEEAWLSLVALSNKAYHRGGARVSLRGATDIGRASWPAPTC